MQQGGAMHKQAVKLLRDDVGALGVSALALQLSLQVFLKIIGGCNGVGSHKSKSVSSLQ